MKRAVLPCNGLDKAFGVLARELALKLSETQGAQIICPVLLNNSPARYENTLAEADLLVIDGCPTRCATKLANKLGLKIDDKLLVSEQAKSSGLEVGKSLRPGPLGIQLVEIMANGLSASKEKSAESVASDVFESPGDFLTVTYDKFVFKIPVEGYLFNENDCWVRVIGDRARVGVSDFVQQNMTDITYFEPAQLGAEIEQFDEVGSLESGKSMMDVLSPVSGVIVAVNTQLSDNPELVNEDPYGKGWIAEIKLRDFDSDKALLIDAYAYSRAVEKKAAEA
ncbi:MAG: putative zinc-binding protein [Armatimonadota bacterium]|nr:glycine cleavage system protein H [bacterium]